MQLMPVSGVGYSRAWVRFAHVVVILILSLIMAVGLVVGYLIQQHLKQDDQNLHGMIYLLNYNIQQGVVKVPPVAPATTTPPSKTEAPNGR